MINGFDVAFPDRLAISHHCNHYHQHHLHITAISIILIITIIIIISLHRRHHHHHYQYPLIISGHENRQVMHARTAQV